MVVKLSRLKQTNPQKFSNTIYNIPERHNYRDKEHVSGHQYLWPMWMEAVDDIIDSCGDRTAVHLDHSGGYKNKCQ
jgi:hypothetical protein